MPNWCFNELEVKGDERELKDFVKRAKEKTEGTDLSLNSFLPMPEELLEFKSPPRREDGETEEQFRERVRRFVREYGGEDWYDWAIKNWGVKWDVEARILLEDKNKVLYRFESPWGPPIVAFESISRLYPRFRFKLFYFEPGMCFGGVATIRNGKIFDDYHESEEAISWLKTYNFELWEELYGALEEEEGNGVQSDLEC